MRGIEFDCAFGRDPESGGFVHEGNGADRPLSGKSSVQRCALNVCSEWFSAVRGASSFAPPHAHHTTCTSTYPMVQNPVKIVAAALYLTAHTDLHGQRLTYSRLPDRRPGTP